MQVEDISHYIDIKLQSSSRYSQVVTIVIIVK